MTVHFSEAAGVGVSWIASEPPLLERASHALAAGGRVWLVDPVDAPGVEERVRGLGAPAGVIQLVDRHPRDCAALARRLGVPQLRLPFAGVPGSPFAAVPILDVPGWREVALWWPAPNVVVCGEALGTAPYFTAAGERLGVHPVLRIHPPRGLRALAETLAPEHVLVGHGDAVHGPEAAPALADALRGARRRGPSWLGHQLSGRQRGRRG
ncbi:MAG TPA: hypothetical protein VH650_00025 [Gaiellaceae bacterium]|jgi:hypothetical protein